MNILTSQSQTDKFINNYFKRQWLKFFIYQEISWTLLYCFMHTYILIYIILSLVNILTSFGTSKLLHKEAKKYIKDFYVNNKKSNKAISVICNLEKFNGPTFGAFTLNGNSLSFTPFKENLKNEGFIIDNIKKSNIDISVVNTKNSWVNKVFYKGNLYCLELKWDGKKIRLQMPNDEKNKVLLEKCNVK